MMDERAVEKPSSNNRIGGIIHALLSVRTTVCLKRVSSPDSRHDTCSRLADPFTALQSACAASELPMPGMKGERPVPAERPGRSGHIDLEPFSASGTLQAQNYPVIPV
jgi:hypothetical protein